MVSTSDVLVTGGGGFIGSAVVRALVERLRFDPPCYEDGSQVGTVVALLRPDSPEDRLDELRGFEGWRIERADLTNRSETMKVLSRVSPRAVIHVAADRRLHDRLSTREARRLNLEPLETLFSGLAQCGGERLIYTSSSWTLPPGRSLDESTPLAPRSPYGLRKAEAEQRVPALGERYGVAWLTLRLFNVFGRYEDERRLLPYLVSRLGRGEPAHLTSGDQVRDFTDVDDVASAYVAALSAPAECTGKVYHVGSGSGLTVRDFALAAAAAVGDAGLIEFGAIPARDEALPQQVADVDRIRHALGWSARPGIERRIEDVARWWLARFGLEARGGPIEHTGRSR